ncbi:MULTISPECIES: SRPBCC domain-containing protein [unclassified Streptomyces]|uniref:ArsR/SmtB family transcription factor n=1 Tax=unclassified Streptomyces TaxID=2593676 RepID=UPI002DDC1D4F|nr:MULTISPECIES: SRPBCC domain-containing protein [unclassified Streptomyces]WSA96228.1 SRPBCC domain-containing protein [Streptomyces sp. NBC_01795]WSB80642.1 SRPBCC domain-containing protein [Streptomyces sp. NBC_01775]WSS11148.1 SRPBCC domain-containing protein [Streptomyces sp. NBC_01186]WSS39858.1 SRPBCC domain-containing protein [Streptomyces sp. NBC_01187]
MEDEVFKALADLSRRRLLDSLNAHDGQTLRELCAGLDMARQSVSKHLAVLEAAHLVTTVRRGREKLHYLNAVPINALAERWMRQYDRERVRALADLKTALEEETMTDATPAGETAPDFVYTTYIKTTPERLWQALTEPAFTKRYWGVSFISEWTPGATVTWEQEGVTIADPGQVVVAADPPRHLSYTWHTMTEEFAASVGLEPEVFAKLAAEPRSTVSFDLEPVGDLVKLTVTHVGFPPGSTTRQMVGEGWPRILSDLKTLLETGETLTAGGESD